MELEASMKVLFLDVDGVLNNNDDFKGARSTFVICDTKVDRLIRLIKELGLKVVLSSTWRTSVAHVEYLKDKGVISPLWMHDDWRTGEKWRSYVRGEEIQEWLDKHPEVTAYAILDDYSDMLDCQLDRFVRTNEEHGLTDEDCEKVRALFQAAD